MRGLLRASKGGVGEGKASYRSRKGRDATAVSAEDELVLIHTQDRGDDLQDAALQGVISLDVGVERVTELLAGSQHSGVLAGAFTLQLGGPNQTQDAAGLLLLVGDGGDPATEIVLVDANLLEHAGDAPLVIRG